MVSGSSRLVGMTRPGQLPTPERKCHMRVECSNCSKPITLSDAIESNKGRLSHIDCSRPGMLTTEENALLSAYCYGHAVAYCLGCDLYLRLAELVADASGRCTNLCPRCHRDLTQIARAHVYGCAMLPSEVRLRAQAVREAAQQLVKESQQLRDRSDVLIREAEAALFESQQALHAAMRRGSPRRI